MYKIYGTRTRKEHYPWEPLEVTLSFKPEFTDKEDALEFMKDEAFMTYKDILSEWVFLDQHTVEDTKPTLKVEKDGAVVSWSHGNSWTYFVKES